MRSTNVRDTELFDVDRALHLDLLADRFLRAPVPARRHAGEHPLEHDPAQRITVSEVLIGLKLHLGLAVRGPNPRSPHLDTTATERHLAILVAMTHRRPLGVVLALRADDVVDLLGHQLLEHAKPDTDAQRQQPFLRCPNQLAQLNVVGTPKHRTFRRPPMLIGAAAHRQDGIRPGPSKASALIEQR